MKRAVKAGLVLALLNGVFASAPEAQSPASPVRTPIDVSKLGPQVGQRIPDFTLTDQHGKIWTDKTIRGPKGAMLVFFRSADW